MTITTIQPTSSGDRRGLDIAVAMGAGVGGSSSGVAVGGRRGIWMAPAADSKVAVGVLVGGNAKGVGVPGGGVSVGGGVTVGELAGVSSGNGVGMSVGEGTGVSVGAGVGVASGVSLGAGIAVSVGEGTGVSVGRGVAVLTGDDWKVVHEAATPATPARSAANRTAALTSGKSESRPRT
jgi:hypothetical protein